MTDDKGRQAKRVAADNGVSVALFYSCSTPFLGLANLTMSYVQNQSFWCCDHGRCTLVPCTHTCHVCLSISDYGPAMGLNGDRTYLTKPDSIVQSLTHALIKLLPGVGVGFRLHDARHSIDSSRYLDNIHNIGSCHSRTFCFISILDLWGLGCHLCSWPSHGSRRRTRQ